MFSFSAMTGATTPTTVFSYGNRAVSKAQVEKYIEDLYLKDSVRMSLFKSSQDYQSYVTNKKKWTAKHYDQGLKLFTYINTLDFHLNQKSRSYLKIFSIKSTDVEKNLLAYEEKSLKKYLSEGENIGIVKARKKFGADLINNNYPHTGVESHEEIYDIWLDNHRKRITQELNIKRLSEYLHFTVSNHTDLDLQKEVSMFDISPFYEKTKALLPLNQKGFIPSKDLEQILTKYPEVKLLITGMNTIDFKTTPINKLNFTTNTDAFQAFNGLVKKSFSHERVDKIISLQKRAGEFSIKYTSQELKQKTQFHLEEYFFSNKEYAHYILSALYNIAIDIQEKKITLVSQKQAKNSLISNFANITSQLTSIDKTQKSEKTLKDYSKEVMNKNLSTTNGKVKKLISILAQYDFLVLEKTFNYSTHINLSSIGNDVKVYNKIKNHLATKLFQERLKSFHENDLNHFIEWNFQMDGKQSNQILNFIKHNDITKQFK